MADAALRPAAIGRPEAGGCGPCNTAPSNGIQNLTAWLPELQRLERHIGARRFVEARSGSGWPVDGVLVRVSCLHMRCAVPTSPLKPKRRRNHVPKRLGGLRSYASLASAS